MPLITDGKKVLIVRKTLDMNQSQLAKKLVVSTALVSSIERGDNKFTDRIKDKFVESLGVNRTWITDSEGDVFSKLAPNFEKLNEIATRVLAELMQPPMAPLSTAGIAIGISTADVVQRLCLSYSAKNLKDLALNHLQVSPATISGWIKRERIPDDQILKVINEGVITPEQLLSNDEYVLVKKLDLVDIIREMYVGRMSPPQTTSEIKSELERLLHQCQKPLETKEGGT